MYTEKARIKGKRIPTKSMCVYIRCYSLRLKVRNNKKENERSEERCSLKLYVYINDAAAAVRKGKTYSGKNY